MRASRRAPNSRKQSERPTVSGWYETATVTTSMFVSFMVVGISHCKRSLHYRMKTVENFQKLLVVMACGTCGLEINFAQIGTQVLRKVKFDSKLLMPSNVWPSLHIEPLKNTWGKFAGNRAHTLASSFTNPTLGDFLAFSLDPDNEVARRVPGLRPLAYYILSQIAWLLDEHITKVSKTVTEILPQHLCKSRHDYRARFGDLACATAMMLWNRDGSLSDADSGETRLLWTWILTFLRRE